MKQFVWFIVIFSVFKSVFSTLCYDCVSLNQPWCTEHFVGKDVSAYRDNLINCTGNCMKLIAHVDEKREFYVRTCDITKGQPSKCTTASQVLGIPLSTVCVCDADRCNGGVIESQSLISIICAMSISILYNI